MGNLNDLLQTDQAKKLLADSNTLRDLKNAPESQRLMENINNQFGGNLEQITRYATDGDTTQLMHVMKKLMNDPENQKLLERLSKNLPI